MLQVQWEISLKVIMPGANERSRCPRTNEVGPGELGKFPHTEGGTLEAREIHQQYLLPPKQ